MAEEEEYSSDDIDGGSGRGSMMNNNHTRTVVSNNTTMNVAAHVGDDGMIVINEETEEDTKAHHVVLPIAQPIFSPQEEPQQQQQQGHQNNHPNAPNSGTGRWKKRVSRFFSIRRRQQQQQQLRQRPSSVVPTATINADTDDTDTSVVVQRTDDPLLFHMLQEGQVVCCDSSNNNNNNQHQGRQGRTCTEIVDCCNIATVWYRSCPNDCYGQGSTPLHQAVRQGACIHVIQAILNTKGKQAVFDTDVAGNTPLHYYWMFNRCKEDDDRDDEQHEILKCLLPAATVANQKGDLPLHCAVVRRYCHRTSSCAAPPPQQQLLLLKQFLLLLLRQQQPIDDDVNNHHHPADPLIIMQLQHQNKQQQTPLHLYCQDPHAMVEVAELLLPPPLVLPHQQKDNTAVPVRQPFCLPDTTGWNPLHYAASTGNTKLVEWLLMSCQEENKELLLDRTRQEGRTVLHLLCNNHSHPPPPISLIKQRLLVTASWQDSIQGSTPLHLLLSNSKGASAAKNNNNHHHQRRGADDGLVPSIEALAPHSAHLKDNRGYLPIHYAVQIIDDVSGSCKRIVDCLLRVHPAGASAVTRKHDTALSLACSTVGCSFATVRKLVEVYPSVVHMANDYGFLPLHCLCKLTDPPIDVIRWLIEGHPDMLDEVTHAGETPANLTIRQDVLDLLLVQHHHTRTNNSSPSTSVRTSKKIETTPLHYACFRKDSAISDILAMSESHPEWLTSRNHHGYTPLQLLCKNGRICPLIIACFSRLMVADCRGGDGDEQRVLFAAQDAGGNTPLHSAIRREMDPPSIVALMEVYPDALQAQTMYGDTPLHLSVLRHTEPSLIRDMAKQRPSVIQTWNHAGQSPLCIAMEEYRKLRQGPCNNCNPELGQAFDRVAVLIKIHYYGCNNDGDDESRSLLVATLLLHQKNVYLDLGVFLDRVIELHPEEIRRPIDSEGNYPLHLEASIPITAMSKLGGDQRRRILKVLLDKYPHAASCRNGKGDYPLQLLIQNQGSGGPWDQNDDDDLVPEVAHAFPQALSEIRFPAGSLPEVLAQLNCRPNTIFGWLRAEPSILGCSNENSPVAKMR